MIKTIFKNLKGKTSLILTVVLLAVVAISIPQKSYSQGPDYFSVSVPVLDNLNLIQNTTDAANTTALQQKESTLDAIQYAAAKVVINNITNSIVNWINSGFEGGPAFVTDPEAFLVDVGDQIAGNFIAGTEIDFLCEPFQLELRRALNIDISRNFVQANYCRLSDIVSNVENFTKFTDGDFTRGGWNSWFEISQNSYGNPLGVYNEGRAEIAIRTARGQEIELAKLNWGQGFLSWRDCLTRDSEGECLTYSEIKTPGSVIEDQLSQTLGTGVRQLELADEINEIVGALVGQLAQTVLADGLSSFGSGGRNYNSIRSRDLTVSCYADRSSATVGQAVKWTAFVYGGSGQGTNSYLWSGTSPIFGTTESVSVVYSTPGSKTASVRVTRDGQNLFRNCYSEVQVSI